jgi:hypothetical protein
MSQMVSVDRMACLYAWYTREALRQISSRAKVSRGVEEGK